MVIREQSLERRSGSPRVHTSAGGLRQVQADSHARTRASRALSDLAGNATTCGRLDNHFGKYPVPYQPQCAVASTLPARDTRPCRHRCPNPAGPTRHVGDTTERVSGYNAKRTVAWSLRTLSPRGIRSRDRRRDNAVEVPEPRFVVPGVIAEIQIRGAMEIAIRELQPDRLINADAIATHGAPQKPRHPIHPVLRPRSSTARTLRHALGTHDGAYPLFQRAGLLTQTGVLLTKPVARGHRRPLGSKSQPH